jgi:hypothetical protein
MLILVMVGVGLVLAASVQALEIERLAGLWTVFVEGPTADANLAGRLGFWSAVVDLTREYPLGTLGPPSLILGTAIDNTWFRSLAQGSVMYLASSLLLMAAPIGAGRSPIGEALALVTLVLIAAGMTQTPMYYPVVYLFWLLLGAGLQWSVDTMKRARPLPHRRLDSRREAGAEPAIRGA